MIHKLKHSLIKVDLLNKLVNVWKKAAIHLGGYDNIAIALMREDQA